MTVQRKFHIYNEISVYVVNLFHDPGQGSEGDEDDDSWVMVTEWSTELRVTQLLITVTQLHLDINWLLALDNCHRLQHYFVLKALYLFLSWPVVGSRISDHGENNCRHSP